MALFNECMQSCAHIVLDTADIVRDGDFSPTDGPGQSCGASDNYRRNGNLNLREVTGP